MNLDKAFIGGLFGAIIGCGIWIAVGYFTGYEIGILAVVVGLLCGIGAGMGSKGMCGKGGGLIAALLTFVAIVAARYVIVQLAINDIVREAAAASGEIPGPENDIFWTAYLADRIVKDREHTGLNIEWPEDADEDDLISQYPADIWMQARGQWNDLNRAEQEQLCAIARPLITQGDTEDMEGARTIFSIIGILYSNLHPIAIVLMVIAMGAAYRTAANSTPVTPGDSTIDPVTTGFVGMGPPPIADGPTGLPGMPAPSQAEASARAKELASLTPKDLTPGSYGAVKSFPGMPPPSTNTPPAAPRARPTPPSRPADTSSTADAPLGLPGMPPPSKSAIRPFNR